MRDHPCFSCSLPDCDDHSRRCALRRAAMLAQAKCKSGEAVESLGAEEKVALRDYRRMTDISRRAQRSDSHAQVGS